MTTLTKAARETIRWTYDGATITGYVRRYYPDGRWGGDTCGCVDDRCIGYHHDETDECGCLPGWLEEYYRDELAAAWWSIVASGSGDGWLKIEPGAEVEVCKELDRQRAHHIAENWRRTGYTVDVRRVERARLSLVNAEN